MKIDDPGYVLRLWADSVRPSVRRARPRGFDRPSDCDDRRLQARIKVETCPGFFKCKPVLWTWFVLESQRTLRDEAVVAGFMAELSTQLAQFPLIVDDEPAMANDFEVTVTAAVEMLAGYGTPVSERTILRWCAANAIFSREQGRLRYVRWSQVKERAPRRRRTA